MRNLAAESTAGYDAGGAGVPATPAPDFDAVRGVLEDLGTTDPLLVDAELLPAGLRHLTELKNRLGAIEARWLAASRTREVAGSSAPAALTTWMRDNLGTDTRQAAKQVGAGDAAATLTPVAEALDTGRISVDHAASIGRTLETLSPDATADADDLARRLVGYAKTHTPSQTARHGRELVVRSDPDQGDDRARRQRGKQWLTLRPRPDGMVRTEGLLTAENGEYLAAAMQPFLTPAGPDDARGPAERRADALGEVAVAAMAAGELPDANGVATQALITVDLRWLEERAGRPATTGEGEPLSPETVKRILCDADISRVVTRGRSEVIDVGRKTSTWPAATRRGVLARDRNRCRRCGRRAQTVHHVQHWADKGPTCAGNGIGLCTPCHINIHETGTVVELHPDASVTFTGPDGQVLERPPPGSDRAPDPPGPAEPRHQPPHDPYP